MVISTAKLTSKYQIVLPAEIRRRLHLQAGDVVSRSTAIKSLCVRSGAG